VAVAVAGGFVRMRAQRCELIANFKRNKIYIYSFTLGCDFFLNFLTSAKAHIVDVA